MFRGNKIWLCAVLLHMPLMAEGFNTCTIAQSDLTMRSGVERPRIRAYDNVCMAVLPPTCRNYTVDGKPCAYRQCLVPDNLKSCPNGDIVAFTAVEIKPFFAKPVRPFTKEEREAMNHAIDAAAAQLAAKWTDNGRVPLSPGANTVLHNMSCQMVASANPDVRCVSQ